MLFSIVIDAGDAISRLKRTEPKSMERRALALAAGRAANRVRARFGKLNSERSPRSNFYDTEGARKVTSSVDPDGESARVEIASLQMLHKLVGGTVRPKNASAIAVPLTEWARGVSREKSGTLRSRRDLFAAKSRSGKLMLWRVSGLGGDPEPEFVLLRHVTHRPHPEIIPPEKEFEKDLESAAKTCAKRL